ncbi:MAG: hypothetical protein HC905_32460 [Bacteroidales bacterium]|nr:hypothetical protein [Bacteroidales bacterium]
MKKSIIKIAFILIAGFGIVIQSAGQVKKLKEPEHPRLLLLKGEESVIKQTIANNPTWAKNARCNFSRV